MYRQAGNRKEAVKDAELEAAMEDGMRSVEQREVHFQDLFDAIGGRR